MTGSTTNITNTREKCAGCDNMCISRLTIMSGMDEARQNQIIDSAVRRKYRKGRYLFREGDPCDGIYILRTGKVKLRTYDAEGREEIAGIFWAGEIIWEGIFIKGSTYPYDEVCMQSDLSIGG